jgi:hypothetical protein
MSEETTNRNDPSQVITRGGWWFLALWSAGLLGLCLLTGYLGVHQLTAYKHETERIRHEFWAPSAPHAPVPSGATRPVDVRVGVTLNRISEVDAKEAGWTADFYLWFLWRGEGVDPGKNFQLENGKILERELVLSQVVDGEHFERYRVTARMIKSFDAARVPVGDQSLSIQIRDAIEGADRLRYSTGARSADIRGLVAPQGFNITRIAPTVRQVNVGSARIASATQAGGDVEHSLFVLAMLVENPVVNRYFRIFQALFASVAICLIVFFIKPVHVDPRFGLPVGAFFAAVGNNISVASSMPETGQVTLVQMVNAISLVTIFLTLVQSAISLYVLDSMGRVRFSILFDRISFVLLGVGYVVLNVLLPMSAR